MSVGMGSESCGSRVVCVGGLTRIKTVQCIGVMLVGIRMNS